MNVSARIDYLHHALSRAGLRNAELKDALSRLVMACLVYGEHAPLLEINRPLHRARWLLDESRVLKELEELKSDAEARVCSGECPRCGTLCGVPEIDQ